MVLIGCLTKSRVLSSPAIPTYTTRHGEHPGWISVRLRAFLTNETSVPLRVPAGGVGGRCSGYLACNINLTGEIASFHSLVRHARHAMVSAASQLHLSSLQRRKHGFILCQRTCRT